MSVSTFPSFITIKRTNLLHNIFKPINNGLDKTKFKNGYPTVAENELVLVNRRQKDEPPVFSEMDELEFF